MKRMLITGASRGIGADLAQHFATSFKIYLHYNSGQKEAEQLAMVIQKKSGKVKLIQADLSTEAGPQIIADYIEKDGASLDVLINNAGVWQKPMPLAAIDWAIMQHSFTVNVFSAIKLTSLCIPFIPKNTQSNIIFLSSVATRLSLPDIAVYTAAKGAIESFTRCFAKGLGPVRINAIAPGVIPTGIHQQYFDANIIEQEQKLLTDFKGKSLTLNLGTTEQINNTVEYIINNANLTGEIIHINGSLGLN